MKWPALFALALALQGCAFGWGGPQRENPASYASPEAELNALRSERDDLRNRLQASRLREDTRNFRNSAFPASGAMDTWQMEGRLSDIDHRIHDLEEAKKPENTSTAESDDD